jgi:steroid delta-isomerase-like uncharacterized protein
MDPRAVLAAISEAENAHQWERMGQLFSDDVIIVHPGLGELVGREANMGWIKMFAGAIDDYRRETFDVIVDGERGALRFTISGRHTGDLPGIPATDLPVEVSGAMFFQVHDGKLAFAREIIEHESLRGISTR